MADSASLVIKVTQKGIDSARKSLDGLAKNAQNADSKTQRLTASTIKLGQASVGAAVGVFGIATAIDAAALAAGTYAKEVQIAANRTGESVERMQALAYATSTVGIDLEKLGDIGKDTEEKIGDFLNTGGGGFQDFADAMNLTAAEATTLAEDLTVLSGAEVLQYMVSEMERAGLATEQMSQALEGMGSDATDLIPLLRDDAKALNELTAEAETSIKILTQSEIAKLQEVGKSINLIGTQAASTSNKLVAIMGDDIIAMNKSFSSFIDVAGKSVIYLVNGMKIAGVSAVSIIANVGIEAEGTFLKAKLAWNQLTGDTEETAFVQKALDDLTKFKQLSDDILNQQFTEAFAGFDKNLADFERPNEPTATVPIAAKLKADTGDATASDEAKARAAKDAEFENAKIQRDKEARDRLVASAEREVELLRQTGLTKTELVAVQQSEEIAVFKSYLDQKLISEQDYENSVLQIKQNSIAKIAEIEEADAARERQLQYQKLQGAQETFQGIGNLAAAFGGKQSKAAKAAFAVSQGLAIAQATMKTYDAAVGAYNSTVNIPIVGPALAPAAATAATLAGLGNVAQIKAQSFSGRMQGGDMNAGQPYVVGERGKEIIVPRGNASAVPNHQIKETPKQAQAPEVNLQVTNSIDSSDLFERGINSPKGSENLMNYINDNQDQIKSTLGMD